MKDTDRFRLLFGPYRTPRFRYGSVVSCRRRGDVIVCGITEARVPWPVARRRGSSARSLVLYGALLRAVQRESAHAVAYWWGVNVNTVTTWRKVLGIEQNNAGTLRLRSDYFHEPWAEMARNKAHAKNNDPCRRAKLSAAMRGRPILPHVRAALLASHVGKKASAETRRKLSEAQKRRGWHPTGRSWTVAEDKMLGQDTNRAIAARRGRTWSSVCSRRERLGIASWRLGRK